MGLGACSNLDISTQLLLEAGEKNLSLARLEAIHHAGDRPLQISAREKDQLLETGTALVTHSMERTSCTHPQLCSGKALAMCQTHKCIMDGVPD